jgi:hypothetical protein
VITAASGTALGVGGASLVLALLGLVIGTFTVMTMISIYCYTQGGRRD